MESIESIKKMNKFYKIILLTMLALFLVGIATAGTVIDSDSITGLTDLSADNITVSYLSGFTQWGYDINSYGLNIWNGTQNYAVYDYIVFYNGFQYMAVSGDDGSILSSSATPHIVIQDALGQSGTIYIKDSCSISSALVPIANTHIIIDASATITQITASTNIFNVNYVDNVTISGGILDANLNGRCIYYENSNNGLIENVDCFNAFDAIYVMNSTYMNVINNYVENASRSGIQLSNTADSIVEGNHINTVNDDGTGKGWGLYSYYNTRVQFIGNTVENMTLQADGGFGISVYENNYDVSIIGNTFNNIGRNGISIFGETVENGRIIVTGNTISNFAGHYGILLSNSPDSIISSNIISTGTHATSSDGICLDNSENSTVICNYVDNVIRGMLVHGNNSRITANSFDGITSNIGIRVSGAYNNSFRDNSIWGTTWSFYESSSSNYNRYENNDLYNPASYPTITGGSSVFLQNWGIKGYNWGIKSTAPSPFGAGDEYYNSTDNKKYCYNGTTWNALY